MLIKEVPIEKIWQLRQQVMYPKETLEFVKLEDDALGIHLGLYQDDRLLSVISLFERDRVVQFRKFATITNEQGKGHGTKLLQYVMDWAIENEKKTIWCNARLSATSLYEKFGMQQTGKSWEKYGIEFIKMQKQLT
ncbi:GNAT family N-acetyltransferase [Terrimonas pollutisoli]|uniref:GNAT family N-acetyltransferase n=1 Tax=Terrimonas pollutisoli TaxID=3034147 RepID=UPI0023EB563F|nr:GNAT family N-acetyltransferase [Terrimonas sp. H1YJ31]